MTNMERIQANNAELREAIQIAEALPEAGGEHPLAAKALIRKGIGYIDTGVDAANSNLTIKVRYEFEKLPTGYWYLIRAYENETTNSTRILLNLSSNATYCCLNSIPSASLTASALTRYEGVVYTEVLKPEANNRFSYTTNGQNTARATTRGNELTGKNILLFTDSATNDNSVVKVESVEIYDGSTLVRDYVPHITESGECGLYDKVTKQFYGNAGEGTFEAEIIEVIAND